MELWIFRTRNSQTFFNIELESNRKISEVLQYVLYFYIVR